MELRHGCRAEYGPLELRIQAASGSNEFVAYVEDPRLEHRTVHEHAIQSTLEVTKEYAISQANQYLTHHKEIARHKAVWRCS